MRYTIYRRRFSSGSRFQIHDAGGTLRYEAVPKLLTLDLVKLSFRDVAGGIHIDIHQIGKGYHAFDLFRDEAKLARVTAIGDRWQRYHVEPRDGPAFDIRTNFLETRYWYTGERGRFAELTKPYFSWSKLAEIDIREGEDDALLLASFVAAQKIADGRKSMIHEALGDRSDRYESLG